MNKYKWILFDADHTLFDFDKASEEALAEVLQEHGIEWSEGMYDDYKKINIQCWSEHERGLINRDTLVYERFRRYFDFRQIDLDPVSTQKKYLRGLGRRPYLMPGAEDMMDWLKGRIKIGYITNGMTEVQRARLQMISWDLKFDVIVIAGEIGHSKPHREYFLHVDQEIGRPFGIEVLVVGDSLTADIEGAASFGYHTCWYNPNDELCHLEKGPDHMITHLDEIKGLLGGGN
ncbi:MAG: YjjG family noncanonical pyrimidine nucleotidase [Saprospiraceae bacterium]